MHGEHSTSCLTTLAVDDSGRVAKCSVGPKTTTVGHPTAADRGAVPVSFDITKEVQAKTAFSSAMEVRPASTTALERMRDATSFAGSTSPAVPTMTVCKPFRSASGSAVEAKRSGSHRFARLLVAPGLRTRIGDEVMGDEETGRRADAARGLFPRAPGCAVAASLALRAFSKIG